MSRRVSVGDAVVIRRVHLKSFVADIYPTPRPGNKDRVWVNGIVRAIDKGAWFSPPTMTVCRSLDDGRCGPVDIAAVRVRVVLGYAVRGQDATVLLNGDLVPQATYWWTGRPGHPRSEIVADKKRILGCLGEARRIAKIMRSVGEVARVMRVSKMIKAKLSTEANKEKA